MHSTDLTKEQASKLSAQFGRMLSYMNNLQNRMDAMDFPSDDPLRADLAKARDARQLGNSPGNGLPDSPGLHAWPRRD